MMQCESNNYCIFWVCVCVCILGLVIIIIIIIIYLSWSWATCWPVPVSRIQKSLQRSAMIPSASWGIVFQYPGYGLVIQHEMRMRQIILSSVAWLSLPHILYPHIISQTARFSGGKWLNLKCVFWFSLQLLFKRFSHSMKNSWRYKCT